MTASVESPPRWQRVLRAASTVLAVLSPFALYVALSRGDSKVGALVLLVWVLCRSVLLLASATRAQRIAMAPLPLLGLVSTVLNFATNDERFLLMLPSITQGSFALVFLLSLRTTPLVEHFARMQKPDLPPSHVAYCRRVTVVWGVVLSVATLVGITLAFTASLTTWTIFTGAGSYAIVGILFAIEYVVRKYKFREYGPNLVDRSLARVFPP